MQETRVQSLAQEDPLEKEMQPTPVFLPAESHGQRSLVGYSPGGWKELDTTERLHFHSHEDLQDLLELTPQNDVLFIICDWNAKEGSQETPGVTGKFGVGVQNEADQRLTEFCQENALVIVNTSQEHKWWLHMDITTKIRLIIFFAANDGEALYS